MDSNDFRTNLIKLAVKRPDLIRKSFQSRKQSTSTSK